jgi:2-amino-4-hydroxy-6-hydroxymethyldihydropteridine diphosphokinase
VRVVGILVVMQQREPVLAYIGIGANLGDAQHSVSAAVQALSLVQGVAVTQASSFYRTAPIDSSGPDYINAVVEVNSHLSAPQLLSALQSIEALHGRERPYRNAPRTLDLDLLLYGHGQIQTPHLTVPHPRMWERAFVLVPLAEIAPHRVSAAQLRAVQLQAIAKLQ